MEKENYIYEEVYEKSIDLSKYGKKELDKFKQHSLNGFLVPSWILIIFHFFTFGLSTFIYFGMIHGKLPKIEHDDPSTPKAIGFMFIPLYNLYWLALFWLRLVKRINFQYSLRKEKSRINETLIDIAVVFKYIPYIQIIGFFTLMPFVIWNLQRAINGLAKESPIQKYLKNKSENQKIWFWWKIFMIIVIFIFIILSLII